MIDKISSFTDLQAWKEAHTLVISIYMLTKVFPKEELFSLVNQMRRCAISISSNIAEGFSRRTAKDKCQFYYIALGSITELQNQLLIARDLGYLTKEDFKPVADKSVLASKLINGLIKSAKILNT